MDKRKILNILKLLLTFSKSFLSQISLYNCFRVKFLVFLYKSRKARLFIRSKSESIWNKVASREKKKRARNPDKRRRKNSSPLARCSDEPCSRCRAAEAAAVIAAPLPLILLFLSHNIVIFVHIYYMMWWVLFYLKL